MFSYARPALAGWRIAQIRCRFYLTSNTTMNDYINITCEDNMELMARYPDNHFDLAIVDPPYGISIDKHANHGGGKRPIKVYNKVGKEWDNQPPTKKYFCELKRVSKNQIIWGGNYFLDNLGNTRCFLIWDKIQEFSGADFEMAWTSFDKASKSFRKSRVEFHNESRKIHPTQKAISLYQWILTNYAKEGYKILDTHIGSGSIAIAIDSVNKIEKMNLTLTGCELDPEYYDKAMARIKQKTDWQSLFQMAANNSNNAPIPAKVRCCTVPEQAKP